MTDEDAGVVAPVSGVPATDAARFDRVAVWTAERKSILDDVSWSVAPGEHWVVLGPNGAGKTTLLSLLGANRHPSSGEVTLLGETFGRTDMRALRRRISLVDPAARTLDWLTAEEVILTGLTNTLWPRWAEWTNGDRARARDLLQLVGCTHLATREIKTLSHGERQRVRIARALMAEPELLLLDEPATGLDLPAREALLSALDGLTIASPALPTVMVSHHLEELPASTSHALLLRDGRMLTAGHASDTLTSSLISTCFGVAVEVQASEGRFFARAAPGWRVVSETKTRTL